MHRLNRFFECTISSLVDFSMRRTSCVFDNFSLPTIYRLNSWDDVRTCSQLCIHHFLTNPYGFSLIYRRHQDNKNLAG